MTATLQILCAALVLQVRSWSCNDESATEVLTKVGLASEDALAVCNDGTEAFYYVKDNGHPTLWLVYLSGGGWCYDEKSCTARLDGTGYPHHDCSNSSQSSPCFGSSKDYPATCGKTGIFDTDSKRTPLAKANKVYLPYCSSDGYMGDGSFKNWQFRGQRIVSAVLRSVEKKGGLRGGSTLVFGGGSAGGRGAMVWLDRVAEMYPKVSVRGFLDSNFYIDVPSLSKSFSGFQKQHTAVLDNFDARNVLSEDCRAAYPREQWKCLFGQFRMPFVKTPYMMAAARFDGWQLSHLVHGYEGIEKTPAFTNEELSYVEGFGNQTNAFAHTLPGAMQHKVLIYSSSCYNHHISEKASFWSVTASTGESENDALQMFLEGRAGSIIDTCDTYNCGSGCSGTQTLQIV